VGAVVRRDERLRAVLRLDALSELGPIDPRGLAAWASHGWLTLRREREAYRTELVERERRKVERRPVGKGGRR
jgi:hypothetical protein